uniref:Uncharacterized protein n=1 Tax=Musca domestica TaxID=7370 RepID=A0A1I8MQ74_MUSDO
MKLLVVVNILVFSAVLVSAQRSRQQRPQRQRSRQPARQGRTLGLISPALNLLNFGGLGTNILGYDAPISPFSRIRPISPLAADPFFVPYRRPLPVKPLADPYYDLYDRYHGYNSFGYKPYYGLLSQLAIRRPLPYGFDPAVNSLYGAGPVAAASAPLRPAATSSAPAAAAAAPTSPSNLSPDQAAQVANLLGQLLGQQLRPLVGGSPAADTPSDDAVSEPENSKRLYY